MWGLKGVIKSEGKGIVRDVWGLKGKISSWKMTSLSRKNF